MLVTILFLISCVITARVLEKKNMRVASVTYSVLFVILLAALLFTVDLELISRALSNMMGAKAYLQVKDALDYVIHSAGYGFCIFIALLLTISVQITLSLICTVVTIVKYFVKRSLELLTKKDNYRCPFTLRALYRQRYINRLYCRMLN